MPRHGIVLPRVGGTKQHPALQLTIPTAIVRELGGIEKLKEYEFEVEVSDAGILFKPLKVRRNSGW